MPPSGKMRNPERDRWQNRSALGFTLIEIIVVLVILGLILGIVVARGPLHSRRLDLDGAARQLAGALRLARSQAIAQNRTVSVLVAADAYRLDNQAAQALPVGVNLTGNSAIAFAPDGSSSGGVLELRSGDRQVDVGVEWLTGRVRVVDGR
jgi:general secretion pathway protein H